MTALTPELSSAILESVRRGTPPRQAVLACGISDETLRRWRQIAAGETQWPGSSVAADIRPETRDRIVAFVTALAEAQAECFQTLTNSLYANATTPNEKTGWFDTQAADRLLSKHPTFRQDWFENKQLRIDSTVTHRHEDGLAESASLEQLEAWTLLELPEATDLRP